MGQVDIVAGAVASTRALAPGSSVTAAGEQPHTDEWVALGWRGSLVGVMMRVDRKEDDTDRGG